NSMSRLLPKTDGCRQSQATKRLFAGSSAHTAASWRRSASGFPRIPLAPRRDVLAVARCLEMKPLRRIAQNGSLHFCHQTLRRRLELGAFGVALQALGLTQYELVVVETSAP